MRERDERERDEDAVEERERERDERERDEDAVEER
jgi:hypothetical protein